MLKAFKFCYSIRNTFFPIVLHKRYSTPTFKPLYENFFNHQGKIAVKDRQGYFTYGDILYTSFLIAKRIENIVPNNYETCERISFLCPNEAMYVSVLLACWITGNMAVPLSSHHPKKIMEYMLENSGSKLFIASESVVDSVQDIAAKLGSHFFTVNSVEKYAVDNFSEFCQSKYFRWDSDTSNRNALMIYTSGTTGVPKGVALTHGNLFAQVSSLVKAWEITSQDIILHTLPLHHMHGIMNALLCLLHAGGTIVMLPKFNVTEVWNHLINTSHSNPKVNLYYGVPTMYVKLIEACNNMPDKLTIKQRCLENIRLMTSGSAALPESVFNKWEEITGHVLLERYGMSEIGMALSNPLNGPRVPGSVGTPLPGVEVKIVDESSYADGLVTYVEGNDSQVKVLPNCEDKQGELLIRGQTVFKGYWNNQKATQETFTDCGWFKTGDIAKYESGYFKILGRISADIIKHKGYKISALSIEACLLNHPKLIDCAVLGVPDEESGENIACLLVTENNVQIDEELLSLCKQSLPFYSKPSVIKYTDSIPRNAMGKMNKKELRTLF